MAVLLNVSSNFACGFNNSLTKGRYFLHDVGLFAFMTIQEIYPHLSEVHRKRFGNNVATAHRAITRLNPDRKQEGQFMVNDYPITFLEKINKTYKRYLKKYPDCAPEKPKRKRVSAIKVNTDE